MSENNENTEMTSEQQTASVTHAALAHATQMIDDADIPHALTRNIEYNVSFKLPKGTMKDDKGNPINELGEPVIKRAPFKISLPVPTLEGLIAALRSEKEREYVLDLVAEEIYRAARQQTDSDDKPANSTEDLDFSKLTLNFLANQPPAERRGGGIPKETWEAFGKSYLEVMSAVTERKLEVINNAMLIFQKRLQTVKSNKSVLTFLEEQLALWFVNLTPDQQDEFAQVYSFLGEKCKVFLAADESSQLADLL